MRPARLPLAGLIATLWLAGHCGVALAGQSAKLAVSFAPEHLGEPTTVSFAFRISSSTPRTPVPLTNVGVLLPSEMGIAESGLGLENCRALRLEEEGPKGCPSNSRMGSGFATAQVPIGAEPVVESAQIELFSAPVVDGHLALLVYANAIAPVSAQLIFPAFILPAPAPFGENVDTQVPLVPSLPEGPDVAITSFHASLGSAPGQGHFRYYRSVHGKRVSFAPRGLILPPTCPRGGFRFEAQFSFRDQSATTAVSTVPCPHHARRLGAGE
jgi:hypothetical protein